MKLVNDTNQTACSLRIYRKVVIILQWCISKGWGDVMQIVTQSQCATMTKHIDPKKDLHSTLNFEVRVIFTYWTLFSDKWRINSWHEQRPVTSHPPHTPQYVMEIYFVYISWLASTWGKGDNSVNSEASQYLTNNTARFLLLIRFTNALLNHYCTVLEYYTGKWWWMKWWITTPTWRICASAFLNIWMSSLLC